MTIEPSGDLQVNLKSTPKPYLNLACGKIVLPAPQPAHHAAVPEGIYSYPYWVNVDKHPQEGVVQADLFKYPWSWEDNSFDGALLTHLVEHIPHEVGEINYDVLHSWEGTKSRYDQLKHLDGFYAFFGELHRVLTKGAVAHIIVPYAFSTGAFQDPTHRRYMTPESFTYLVPDPNAPFEKEMQGAWEIEMMSWNLTEQGNVGIQQAAEFWMQQHVQQSANRLALVGGANGRPPDPNMLNELDKLRYQQAVQQAMMISITSAMNVAADFYISLKVVK